MVGIWDFVNVFLVLGVMILVFYFSMKLLKKYMGQSYNTKNSPVAIEIIHSKVILPKKYLSVVKVNNEFYLLGISDQNINLIEKMKDIDYNPSETENKGRTFFSYFKENMGMSK
ncbi:MAG: flagellar biosynthetic protein FliO [Melioribacteraceae bacterium]|nr:flagellar biosynthetic protein FliO [Melioribacteraceae bacterium]MCF8355140.1 flagellar biosynthetic protein FliO [Melioribacteraceae bacterium]MCF8392469.1 flagellar biosynthetic protein FliO [Melioribacteraceae bacterium]MCF8418380.1 flagellar biosynthetic protein FliO [Melioribacteraceae bacterium]